jgi:hypothetical protein
VRNVRSEKGDGRRDFEEMSRADIAAAAAICRLMEGGTLQRGMMIAVNALAAIIAAQGLGKADEKRLVGMFTVSLSDTVAARRDGRLETIGISEVLDS